MESSITTSHLWTNLVCTSFIWAKNLGQGGEPPQWEEKDHFPLTLQDKAVTAKESHLVQPPDHRMLAPSKRLRIASAPLLTFWHTPLVICVLSPIPLPRLLPYGHFPTSQNRANALQGEWFSPFHWVTANYKCLSLSPNFIKNEDPWVFYSHI